MVNHARANILIVDDRPENLLVLENILESLGQNLIRATSGQEALGILYKGEFAAILLDVRMPGMDGFETAQYIRQAKRTQYLPIIFITAGDENIEHTIRGYSVGAVDYITKPIQVEILKSKVKVFVDLYLNKKELAEKADALARANEELRIAYKELETFSYTMAHDLRAPLRAMHGFCQLLREDYAGKPLDEAGQEYTRRIEDGAKRMDTLIHDLLGYCHVAQTKGQLERLDPGAIIHEVLARTTGESAHAALDVSVNDGFPPVLGHRHNLAQVLQHLVSNAAKFVGPDIRPRLRISHETDHERVRIWIDDNGIGISPEHHDRIFKPFERLDPAVSPGTGMGLAVVKTAMEHMGGRVGVKSEPGKGSRFWIELPLYRGAVDSHSNLPSHQQS